MAGRNQAADRMPNSRKRQDDGQSLLPIHGVSRVPNHEKGHRQNHGHLRRNGDNAQPQLLGALTDFLKHVKEGQPHQDPGHGAGFVHSTPSVFRSGHGNGQDGSDDVVDHHGLLQAHTVLREQSKAAKQERRDDDAEAECNHEGRAMDNVGDGADPIQSALSGFKWYSKWS